jgi:hypothetical protein
MVSNATNSESSSREAAAYSTHCFLHLCSIRTLCPRGSDPPSALMAFRAAASTPSSLSRGNRGTVTRVIHSTAKAPQSLFGVFPPGDPDGSQVARSGPRAPGPRKVMAPAWEAAVPNPPAPTPHGSGATCDPQEPAAGI